MRSHKTVQMTVSFNNTLEHGRAYQSIGRIRTAAPWQGDLSSVAEADRLSLVRALIHEAESYAADAIVELQFDVENIRSADIDGALLRRVTATGVAVRYAEAA